MRRLRAPTGYMQAMREAGIQDNSNPEFHGFHEYIRNKFGFFEATMGWSNIITAITLKLARIFHRIAVLLTYHIDIKEKYRHIANVHFVTKFAMRVRA